MAPYHASPNSQAVVWSGASITPSKPRPKRWQTPPMPAGTALEGARLLHLGGALEQHRRRRRGEQGQRLHDHPTGESHHAQQYRPQCGADEQHVKPLGQAVHGTPGQHPRRVVPVRGQHGIVLDPVPSPRLPHQIGQPPPHHAPTDGEAHSGAPDKAGGGQGTGQAQLHAFRSQRPDACAVTTLPASALRWCQYSNSRAWAAKAQKSGKA